MNPKGGTEILKEQLLAQLPEESLEGINLTVLFVIHLLLKKIRLTFFGNICYDQPNVQYMR